MEYRTEINGIRVNAAYQERENTEIFLPLLRRLRDLQERKERRILVLLAAPPGAGKSTLLSFLEHLAGDLRLELDPEGHYHILSE